MIKGQTLVYLLIKTQNKITIYTQDMNNHFSSIASKYRSVRTLDIDPISIWQTLAVEMVDIRSSF